MLTLKQEEAEPRYQNHNGQKAIDPTLNALFATSSGPVKAPPVSRYSQLSEQKNHEATDDSGDDEVLSEISEELDDEDDDGDESEEATSEAEDDETEGAMKLDVDEDNKASEATKEQTAIAPESTKSRKDRKRKRKDENDDLEEKYLAELTKSDEPTTKRRKDLTSPEKADNEESDDGDDVAVPVHESLSKEEKPDELDKAARTVFLANVSSEAITSKTAKKTLLSHLSSVLAQDASPPEKIESIRFRSLAFSTGSMPKRAAFITGSLMEATTKSANAYVVYPTPAAARKAAAELNGSEVLGRHIRVDSVAHPSPTDHRRCVFVGNLGFVDDETVLNTNGDGETTKKKRTKVPSDVEEGLWRTFSTQGKVENVRVVRDPKTRVGKGFAYVQFYPTFTDKTQDGNDVESALLLDGKKFPPMLPRALRVTRAKDPRKTALAQERAKARGNVNGGTATSRDTKYKPKITPEQQSMAGRAGKLLGRAGAAQHRRASRRFPRKDQEGGAAAGLKTPEQIIFEGSRASSKDGNKGLKFGKKSKPSGRGARRAAAWKKKKT
ncbi:RNA recognition domain-containing protein [Paramyrothecium foliicola]|nr:RNA recognition domain-containing protein [Paramyrothecium foliicola]